VLVRKVFKCFEVDIPLKGLDPDKAKHVRSLMQVVKKNIIHSTLASLKAFNEQFKLA
jgi:hypothetical protein